MEWISKVANQAESLLESVDARAAGVAEDIRQRDHTKANANAVAAAEQLASRPRYVSRAAARPTEAEGSDAAVAQFACSGAVSGTR